MCVYIYIYIHIYIYIYIYEHIAQVTHRLSLAQVGSDQLTARAAESRTLTYPYRP